ncbi:rRNA maturation RNase YbeY [Enorma phocaeensis]|uniref:rRNA maturation RNase YbeY n=1 Tax=Enorma phocaeensis TaxID=1871019 RepID=UPI0023541FE7|nr:rRNA maturation RNase YbeY [Enorma phocaeensis]
MGVLVSFEEGVERLLDAREIEEICAAVLAAEGIDRPVEVSVSFVGDEQMRELNATWRGIDAPTDVLSFECDAPDDPGLQPDEVVELGDIMLAPMVIARQAPGFKTTAVDECRLMLVHGMLHLLGYDHLVEDEALAMEARELEILRALASARGDDPSSVVIGPTTRHEDEG